MFNLAHAYLQADHPKNWRRSARLLLMVISNNPKYDEAIHHLASAYWKLNNKTEAVKYDRLYLERGHHADLKARSKRRLSASGPGR